MPGSTAVAVTIAATIIVAAASLALMILSRRGRPSARNARRLLLLAALASALLAGAGTVGPAIEDSGVGFAITFTAVPVAISLVPIAAFRFVPSAAPVLAWMAALAMLAFVAIFAAGPGFFYLPTAVLAVAAAVRPGRA